MTQPPEHNPNGNTAEFIPSPVPPDVSQALAEQAAAVDNREAWHSQYPGRIGWTMFDTPSSEDGTVTVLLAQENINDLPSQSLVRIRSKLADGNIRSYLGIVVKGPFAEPDNLRADAPIVVTVTVMGLNLISKYHGRTQVELLGQELDDGTVVPALRRPLPNSPVYLLDSEEVARVLHSQGTVRLGLAEGHEHTEVLVPPKRKEVFPRHTGILGTTGGGKSTTVSGLIAQLQRATAACVVLDTEGEYTAITDPTDSEAMQRALERRGLKPAGVDNTHIYHLVGRETANPDHPSRSQFYLPFEDLSPYAVTEILELSDAQRGRYWQAYEVAKGLLREFGVFPSRAASQAEGEERQALELDEFESGYPRMTLSHLLDVSLAFLHVVSKDEGEPRLYNQVFKDHLKRVMERVGAAARRDNHADSWRALRARLWQLHRLNIFDVRQRDAAPIDYQEMLQPGRVSIVDLSDMEATDVKNLTIAQLLKGIQRQQEASYLAAQKQGQQPTLAMVFIEEAHEFLSTERIRQMPVLFQQVARIARRGRKRWLGLVFITQLPQHLPDEVLGLLNNWVLHKINDANVVSRLRRSIGGIDGGLWERLPSLAPGQAVVSFTSLARPLLVAIDPSPCRLLMTE